MNKNIIESKIKRNRKVERKKRIMASKELLNNEEYFTWLNEFTNNMPIFLSNSSNDIDYELPEKDKLNVKNIYKLFYLTDLEAHINHVEVNVFKNGKYYIIENLGEFYQIGSAIINHDWVFFCSRCDKNEKDNIINIDELRKQIKTKKEQDIEELKKLKNLVIKLLEREISEDDIKFSINEGIEEYKGHQLIKMYLDTD